MSLTIARSSATWVRARVAPRTKVSELETASRFVEQLVTDRTALASGWAPPTRASDAPWA